MTLDKTNKEILIEAKQLLSNPDKWQQSGCYATTSNGRPVALSSERASCFCIMGAVLRVTKQWPTLMSPRLKSAMTKASPKISGVIPFNDDIDTTHQDVMEFFDRAIEGIDDES